MSDKYKHLKIIDPTYIEKIANGYIPTLVDYELARIKLIEAQPTGGIYCVMPAIILYIHDADVQELKKTPLWRLNNFP